MRLESTVVHETHIVMSPRDAGDLLKMLLRLRASWIGKDGKIRHNSTEHCLVNGLIYTLTH